MYALAKEALRDTFSTIEYNSLDEKTRVNASVHDRYFIHSVFKVAAERFARRETYIESSLRFTHGSLLTRLSPVKVTR